MTTRPVIFSAPMIQALLAGRKTQTRRITPCPLAKAEVGDLLWVREAFTIQETSRIVSSEGAYFHTCLDYAADGKRTWIKIPEKEIKPAWRRRADKDGGPFTRPAMYFPRRASRFTLRVTRVRNDRLQMISADDVLAEGCPCDPRHRDRTVDGSNPHMVYVGGGRSVTPRLWFHELWDSLHDKPGERWEDNPMVVALQFEVLPGNVDAEQHNRLIADVEAN